MIAAPVRFAWWLPKVCRGSALVPFLALLALLAMDRWVYVDAQAHAERGTPVIFRGGSLKVDTPAAWALVCLILWALFFPLYLASRR